MRIGILGGTFDPPHTGHITMAKKAFEQLNLAEVWIMPTGNPGYKGREDITDKYIRAKMVELAISEENNLKFSDIELKRDGLIYTRDTLTILKEQYPEHEFFFIIGGDSINDIKKWYKPEEIFKLCTICAVCRDDICDDTLNGIIKELRSEFDAKIELLNIEAMNISSSGIREKIKKGVNIENDVPKKVAEYIISTNLYK